MKEKDFIALSEPLSFLIIKWIVNVQRDDKLDDIQKLVILNEMFIGELKKQYKKLEFEATQAMIEAKEDTPCGPA